MSLLRPTPGQIMDRFAALLVKRDAFIKAEKPYGHISKELMELAAAMPERSMIDHKSNFYSLHLRMWQLVDIVGASKDKDEVFVSSKTLYSLNLERHALIARIDDQFGVFEGDEKL